MAIVHLTTEDHKLLIHPVLSEKIRARLLNPARHSSSLIRNFKRCKEHLLADFPFVMKTKKPREYFVLCPVFVVILKTHQWLAFEKMKIPAVTVKMSDDEVEEMFWAKTRSAFSLVAACRELLT